MEVYERVCNACRKYGKTAGLSCAFDKIPEFMEQGFRFFVGGADYLVIGRPITQAPDPQAALQAINAQIGI